MNTHPAPIQVAAATSWQKRVGAVAGLAVTIAALAVLASRVDIAHVVTALGSLPWPALLAACACIACAYAAKIARWHLMLTSVSPVVTVATAGQTLLASVALNNVLPFRAGDVARMFAFRDQLGATPTQVVPLLVLERILDALMLLVLAGLVAIPMGREHLPASLVTFAAVAFLAGAAVLALAVLGGARHGRLADWLLQLAGRLPSGLRASLFNALDVLSRQLQGRQGAALLALTAVAWTCEGAMFVALAHGFSVPRPILAGYCACALATLATLVPSSPGFFGTFHAAAVAALEVAGADRDTAAAYAILAHGIMWAPLTLIGLACMMLVSARRLLTPAPETP